MIIRSKSLKLFPERYKDKKFNQITREKQMQLTPNFTLAELIHSETAKRLNIPNEPGKKHIDNLKHLASTVLQPIRDKFGPYSPTSGFRSAQLNQRLGGAPNSDHMLGFAADIKHNKVSNYELAKWIEANLNFTQLILEYPGDDPFDGWVHVASNTAKRSKSIITIGKNGVTNGLNPDWR